MCLKTFTTKRSLLVHDKTCKKKTQRIKDLENEVKILRAQTANTSTSAQNITVHSGGGDVNMVNYVININSSDAPSLSKIKKSKVLGISLRKDAVERLTKHIYFNKSIPENHSIYAPTTNTNDLKMHNGTSMRKVRYPDKAIKRIVQKMIDILSDHITNNSDEFKREIDYEYDLDTNEDIDKMESELTQIINSVIDDPNLISKYMNIFYDNRSVMMKSK
jgi:hypothetical protein